MCSGTNAYIHMIQPLNFNIHIYIHIYISKNITEHQVILDTLGNSFTVSYVRVYLYGPFS